MKLSRLNMQYALNCEVENCWLIANVRCNNDSKTFFDTIISGTNL